MAHYTPKVIELTEKALKKNYKHTVCNKNEKSIFCSMVLRLMDTEKYSNDYCGALEVVLLAAPEIDREKLEMELNKYV